MAKILGKDSVTYAKEREGFLRDLHHFHETKGTPFKRPPTINGQEIDLYLLYSLVTAQGGWIKVNSKNAWPDLFEKFNLLGKCVNASIALKQIYLRYLDRWEKVHFLGEEADRGSDDDEESRHKRWSARALHSVPLTYNYSQHNISDLTREYNHLSTDLYKSSDYDRLALSLISPLPNEQDFAINVCTLLSNDGKHTLKLEKCPRILDYLLGHAGVFCHSSLRTLFVHVYSKVRSHPFYAFWPDVVEFEEFLDLTDESKFVPVKVEVKKKPPDDSSAASASEAVVKTEPQGVLVPMETDQVPDVVTGAIVIREPREAKVVVTMTTSEPSVSELFASDEDCALNEIPKGKGFKLKEDAASDRELFCLGRSLGTQDYVGQRVLQIATILRNLSFIDENVQLLVKNQTFIRFMLLCSSSRWSQLRNLGLDMLGNMANDFLVRELPEDKLAYALLRLVDARLGSEDRASCISSLEVLNKLSQNEVNEEALLRHIEPAVYEKVCAFLTLHDVMLLIYTLECLYSLSSLGERSCNLIVRNHGVVDTLVSLVTVEGKSYGPKACIGMKLVETVPGGVTTNASVATSVSSSGSQQTAQPTTSSSTSVPAALTPAMPAQMSPMKPASAATPVRNVQQMQPQRLIAISPAPSTVATPVSLASAVSQSPQQLVQQQHAHQQAIQENEQFALAWLRATCEPCSSARIDHQELYKQYINSCAKIGRRGVIAPLHFPRCVRSVFGGTVGPNPLKPSAPNEQQFYEGIRLRAQPLVINIQSSSSSTTTSVNKSAVQQSSSKANVTPQRRKPQAQIAIAPAPPTTAALTVIADAGGDIPPASPASPILKAQLSAPPKQSNGNAAVGTAKGDAKSQVMAHPHLSQALLGAGTSKGESQQQQQQQQQQQAGQSSTSLIKSLLATKVNNCMTTTASMRTATDSQSVAQVVARQQQQRLLAQQTNQNSPKPDAQQRTTLSRLNGARQLFSETETADTSVSSTTATVNKNRREPPQPPPPLAPLSSPNSNRTTTTRLKVDNEDSDSIGNNSLASSTIGLGGMSSTEDGENSLTSFEGLLNGIPNVESLNEDSNNSKESSGICITRNKPLMLADLLEKKVEKEVPSLNGVINKELRIGDKGLELVENHIEKALSNKEAINKVENVQETETTKLQGVKRSASDDIGETECKKPHLLVATTNGSVSAADSPAPESVTSSNGEEGPTTVSTAAAKLFADIAADILEDEEEEEMLQQNPAGAAAAAVVPAPPAAVQQILVDNNQQQVLMTQPRQIIVSQSQNQQVVLPAGAQLKTQTGQTVIVQNSGQQRQGTMMLQQGNAGQILLSQGQVQLLTSTTQPGQYVLQTGGAQGAYVVAQPQTAVVHGQPQTVLVAQTSQQQGTGTKTIIILQQQQTTNAPTHHQKVMVTPQGQQVVVTQVSRPVMQQSTVTNSAMTTSSTVIKTTGSVVVTQSSMTATEKKPEEKPIVVRPKIIRDLTTPFVCEWGDCQIATKFKSANQVYMHVCETHCPKGSEEITCQWDRCDNMKRKRFSLMTHLYDKHCNTEAMRTSLTKRKQQSHSNKPEAPTPSTSTPHPGYAPDAAFHAIKRHALEFVNPKELQDDNEGPVTKSIRLTASLILRNLVIYSSNCRRYLKHYEPHLANVALSNVESSRTIAQVLYDMNEGSNHR